MTDVTAQRGKGRIAPAELKRKRRVTAQAAPDAGGDLPRRGTEDVKQLTGGAGATNEQRQRAADVPDARLPAAAVPLPCGPAMERPTVAPAVGARRHLHSLALFREIAANELIWPSLQVFATPSRRGRVTLVSESILPARWTGCTEAGFALAAVLARRLDHDLRFLCRQAGEGADAMQTLLDLTDLDWDADIDFRVDGTRGFDLCRSDLLVTTSWQTTFAVARAFDPAQIVYLVEEDERLLGGSEGDMAGFAAALELPGLHCVVKSASLLAYLAGQDLGAVRDASCFEPAFPRRLFYRRPKPAASRVVTAFTNTACLDDMPDLATIALRAAICAGVLPPDRWTVCLFGADPMLPAPRLPADVELVQDTGPLVLAELAGRTDIALCLNRKPYASCRPSEMAAGGAILVGNVADDLQVDAVRTPPDVTSVVRGIAQAVRLVTDRALGKGHASEPSQDQSWSDALGAAAGHVGDRVETRLASAALTGLL